jgi:hypothetical protein
VPLRCLRVTRPYRSLEIPMHFGHRFRSKPAPRSGSPCVRSSIEVSLGSHRAGLQLVGNGNVCPFAQGAAFRTVARRNRRRCRQTEREVWAATKLLDKLGPYTVQSYQRGREATISRQSNELLELSTPVIHLWESILALPIIGTLDSARAQIVLESLPGEIVAVRAQFAIIDITACRRSILSSHNVSSRPFPLPN